MAPPDPFDGAVVLEVLEHVVDPALVLQNVFACVKPGGPVVVSLPNEIHLAARLPVLVGRLPFGGHADHVRHFDRRRARRFLDAVGARVVRQPPVSLLPPRWRVLRTITAPAVRAFPGAFAIATLYLVEKPA